MKISSNQKAVLERELLTLRNKLKNIQISYGEAVREEHKNETAPMVSSLFMEILNCEARMTEIIQILNRAQIVEIDLLSDKMVVEIGDVALIKIQYGSEEPEKIHVKMIGDILYSQEETDIDVASVGSPLGSAIYGKEVGESFEYRTLQFKGTILDITKAKDLEAKKPYVKK